MFYSFSHSINNWMGTMSFMSMHIFPLLRNKQLLPPQLKCVNNFRLHCSLSSISTRRISYRFKEVHYGKEDDLKHISDNFKTLQEHLSWCLCVTERREYAKIHSWNRMQKSNIANKIYQSLNIYKLTISTKTQCISGK